MGKDKGTKDYTLRPCPRCGGEAKIVSEKYTATFCKYGRCEQCGATSDGADDSYYGAVVDWNTGNTKWPGLRSSELIDYWLYIQSDEWKQKAQRAKERAGQRCQVCNRMRGEVTLDAHHRTYDRLGEELMDDITVLCRDCHELYEGNKKAEESTVTTTDESPNWHSNDLDALKARGWVRINDRRTDMEPGYYWAHYIKHDRWAIVEAITVGEIDQ